MMKIKLGLVTLLTVVSAQNGAPQDWQLLDTDARGPCPMINTMANHGMINRNGLMVTAASIVEACLWFQVSAAEGGFPSAWPPLESDNYGFCTGALSDSVIERTAEKGLFRTIAGEYTFISLEALFRNDHVASITRNDLQPNHLPNATRIQNLIDMADDNGRLTNDDFAQHYMDNARLGLTYAVDSLGVHLSPSDFTAGWAGHASNGRAQEYGGQQMNLAFTVFGDGYDIDTMTVSAAQMKSLFVDEKLILTGEDRFVSRMQLGVPLDGFQVYQIVDGPAFIKLGREFAKLSSEIGATCEQLAGDEDSATNPRCTEQYESLKVIAESNLVDKACSNNAQCNGYGYCSPNDKVCKAYGGTGEYCNAAQKCDKLNKCDHGKCTSAGGNGVAAGH